MTTIYPVALPRAIVCANDQTALGAMHALARRGIKVPDEVAVTGFDDVPVARHLHPPLTTVHQPIRRKGEEAVRLLLSVVQGHASRPEHRRLETKLVVRGSTASAPRGRKEVAAVHD